MLERQAATAEHWRRADAAPRLHAEVPRLVSLRLTFNNVPDATGAPSISYAKPIDVKHAPAHFEVRCMEPRCDGRHDLTQRVMRALHQSLVSFGGTSNCNGMINDNACDRLIAYACEASYLT